MPSSDGAVQNSHVVHAQPCLVGYIDYVGLIYYQRSQMRNCRVTFSEECGDYADLRICLIVCSCTLLLRTSSRERSMACSVAHRTGI